MRILKLTDAVAAKFLARRNSHDAAAEKVASRILADVRRSGDAALLRWARKLDGLQLTPRTIWISRAELRAARRDVSRELLRAIEHAARNVRRVAEQQRPRSWTITVEPGVRVGQRVTPLGTIGCYIPGGRFSLFSTLLMTAIPAQVAGVKRIVVACPKASPALLAAAEMRRPLARLRTARNPSLVWTRSAARATATSQPRSASPRTIVRSICPPAQPKC